MRGPVGPATNCHTAVGEVHKLRWTIHPHVLTVIEQASFEIAQLASDCQLHVIEFSHFGKGFIKRMKLHPDFFMQMALQLAFYRHHRTVCATYETGHTRAFYHGRTDTVRSCSTESKAFVLAMEDHSLSAAQKLVGLHAACDAHGAQLQRVLTGQGIDRHLLGLYIVASLSGEELPALFSDPAFKRSGGGGNYRLSTSNVGYTPMFGGFAPMTHDGYGVCYAMLEGRINISVSAWHSCAETCARVFARSIETSLQDMQRLCEAAGDGKSRL